MIAPPVEPVTGGAVLIVEDDAATAELQKRAIQGAGLEVRLAGRVAEAIRMITESSISVALVDYRLPDGDALAVLDAARSASPPIPVIVVTGLGDERIAAEVIHRGAADYVIKRGDFWEELPRVVGRVLQLAAAEKALRKSEEQFRQIAETIDEVFWMTDAKTGAMLYVSPAYDRIWGRSREDLYARPEAWLDAVHEEDRDRLASRLSRGATSEPMEPYRIERPDGGIRWIRAREFIIRKADGEIYRTTGIASDITDLKAAEKTQAGLEDQLRQAQKMEAVGRLAGGVAHDFNNLLSVILGYGNLLLMDPDRRDADRKGLEEICKAAERAGGLTRQLLAFSRKQVLVPEVFDLRDSVQDIAKMLGRLIGEDVELSLSFAKEACRVRADRGQIDQVITNLAVNSRDAMPQGGKLTVEVRHADFTEPMVHDRARIEPGPYVLLAVSDSGVGMNAETRSHVFEPFYTTKGPGEGTGLGLATVYGIVKQSGGYIWLYSEPGEGTTFKIYLPRTEGLAGTAVPVQGASLPGGSETILLVEDDEAVRGLAQLILEERGYRVLAASGGEEAELLAAGWEGPIHLLLSDVIMPGMNGREVADRLCPLRPEMRTIFMSGYTGDTVLRRGIVAEDSDFIQKPFTPTILAVKVRQVLDRAAPRGA
jgi:PAS domain S-box-containing protein